MKTTWRFCDLAIVTTIGRDDERKRANGELFLFGEPIRLWLRGRKPIAPFAKLNVEFVDRDNPSWTPGRAWADPLGIGFVAIAIAKDELFANATNPAWVLPHVELAMRLVEEQLGFRSAELNAYIQRLREEPFPYLHFFEKQARTHRKSGRTFTPLISFAPNHIEIGVRVLLPNGLERQVALLVRKSAFWLEHDFPMSKTTFRDGSFLILDKNGAVLASIPIEDM